MTRGADSTRTEFGDMSNFCDSVNGKQHSLHRSLMSVSTLKSYNSSFNVMSEDIENFYQAKERHLHHSVSSGKPHVSNNSSNISELPALKSVDINDYDIIRVYNRSGNNDPNSNDHVISSMKNLSNCSSENSSQKSNSLQNNGNSK